MCLMPKASSRAGAAFPGPDWCNTQPEPGTAAAQEWEFLPTQRVHSREEHNLRDLQAAALV